MLRAGQERAGWRRTLWRDGGRRRELVEGRRSQASRLRERGMLARLMRHGRDRVLLVSFWSEARGERLDGGWVRRSGVDAGTARLAPEWWIDQIVGMNTERSRVVILVERARLTVPVLPIADPILVARRVVAVRPCQRVDPLRKLALATARYGASRCPSVTSGFPAGNPSHREVPVSLGKTVIQRQGAFAMVPMSVLVLVAVVVLPLASLLVDLVLLGWASGRRRITAVVREAVDNTMPTRPPSRMMRYPNRQIHDSCPAAATRWAAAEAPGRRDAAVPAGHGLVARSSGDSLAAGSTRTQELAGSGRSPTSGPGGNLRARPTVETAARPRVIRSTATGGSARVPP